jgi:hypothetical protein
MARVSVSENDLRGHLKEFLQELRQSAASFDADHHWEAKRCASVMTTLFSRSKSNLCLISQLGMGDRKLVSSCALASRWVDTSDLQVGPGLFLDGYRPALDSSILVFVSIDAWWNQPVLRIGAREFSRGEIIRIVRDQDGGAHIDGTQDIDYADLKTSQAVVARPVGHGGLFIVDAVFRNPARFLIRQFCHEVLKSLDPEYSSQPKIRPKDHVIVWTHATAAPEASQRLDYRDTNGSELCPCGSNVLFSFCHQRGRPAQT